MKSHVVQQGEYLAAIAHGYGFHDWHVIYDHPANADFRKRRPNPNVIFPGDVIQIPPLEDKQVPRSTGSMHTFKVKLPKVKLKIVMKGAGGEAFAGYAYRLEIGGASYQGTTDDKGTVEQEVPVQASDGKLIIEELGLEAPIKVGDLDPICNDDDQESVITGIQARLNNLGFFCGQVDGVLGPRTKAALMAFQHTELGREEPDGEPDEETRKQLLTRHGC